MPVPHVGRPLKRLEDPKLITGTDKGIGESATIGSTPAVTNAVLDTLSPLGVETLDLPLTAAKIWQAMRSAPTGAKS